MSGSQADWVFAYGSNMDVDDLRTWLVGRGFPADGILKVEPAVLPGYRLVWNYYSVSRNGGAANVEPCPGQELPGLALLANEDTLKAIDRKEGHPTYYSRGSSKLAITLRSGKRVDAWVYIAVPEKCSTQPVWPRREYLRLLIAAAKQHDIPDWHVAELEATPTAG